MVYWDLDGATAGSSNGIAPVGTWNGTNTFWNAVSDGTGATSAWTAGDIAVFSAGADATGAYAITIDGTQSVGGLVFEDGTVTLSGGTLALASASDFQVVGGQAARIDSTISGSFALRKTGQGSLRLTADNSAFDGTVTVSSGVLSVSSLAALGSGTSTITIEGTLTRGLGGGQLVLGGSYAAGFAVNRPVVATGGGPGGDGAALLSVGNNSFNALSAGSTTSTRFYAVGGTTTVTSFVGGLGQNSQFNGPGNWVLSNVIISGQTNSLLQKAGAGGMILLAGDNLIENEIRASGGSLRIDTGLGLPVLSTDSGVLELRTDAPGSFVDTRMIARGSATLFVDRAAGIFTGALNQTVVFSDTSYANSNTTHTYASRNGYGISLTGAGTDFGNIPFATGNPITITNSASGLLTFAGNPTFTDGTRRNYTFQGNGDTLITGNVLGTGGVHTLVKGGTGTLSFGGTASTFPGSTNVNAGSISANRFTGLGNGAMNLGSTTTTGRFTYLGEAGTGAGETTAKVINLAGTTGGAVVAADQAGAGASPLVLSSNFAVTGSGVKTLFLAGSSTQENVINGLIQNSSGGATSVVKSGAGTWIYSPSPANYAASVNLATTGGGAVNTNTFTVASTAGILPGMIVTGTNVPLDSVVAGVNGNTVTISTSIATAVANGTSVNFGGTVPFTGTITISNGTMKIRPSVVSGDGSDVVTGGLLFNADPLTGVGAAGGVFEYVGVNDAASVENIGALTLTAGAGTVRLTPTGASGTAQVRFSALTASSTGGSLNFEVPAGGTVLLTSVPQPGFLVPRAYFNGADFLVAPAASVALRGLNYGTDANTNTVAAAVALTASNHNQITTTSGTAGTVTQNSAVAVRTLKFSGATTLTGTGKVTIQQAIVAGTPGGILVTGGSAVISTSGGISTTGAGEMVIRVDGASDQLTLNASILSDTTGGLTKNGAGTLLLNTAQSYTGATTINEGLIQLGPGSRLGGASASNNNNLVVRQSGTLDLNGITIGVGAFNGAGAITNSSGTAATLTIGNNNQVGVFSGLISGNLGLIKTSTGTTTSLTGLNTYTGATQITGGTLVVNRLADIGVASSIGAGNATSDATNAASLVFNNGTLQYTGSNAQIFQTTQTPSVSTDRLFTLAGNGTIDSSGTFGNGVLAAGVANNATLAFSNTGDIIFSGAVGTRSLTLSGTSTGDNELRPRLTDYSGSAVSLTKSGAGLWILNPAVANTYTGITTINGGQLQAVEGVGVPAASPIVLNGASAVFQTSGTFTRPLTTTPVPGGGSVNFGSSGGGFAATTSKLTVNLGPDANLVWASDGFQGTLYLGSPTALSEVEFVNSIELGMVPRTVQVDDNPFTALDFAVMSGTISGDTAAVFTKAGGAPLYLTGENTYAADTALNAGSLVVSTIGNTGSASSNLGAGSGRLLINNATFIYTGTGETTDRPIVMAGTTGGAVLDANGSGPLILTNVVTSAAGGAGSGAKTLTLTGTSAEANEVRSDIVNNGGGNIALTKSGGGIWILSGTNTYSGATNLSGNGAIGIATASPFGNSTVTVTNASLFPVGADRTVTNNILFAGNATEAVFGDFSLTLNGAITFGSNNNTTTLSNFIASGEQFTINGTVTNTDTAANRTLNLNGSGKTVIAGVVRNEQSNNRLTSLTYSGNGHLTLNAANTYTGTTTIAGGAVQASEGVGLPAASNLTFNSGNSLIGGVLQTSGSFTRTLGTGAGQVQWLGGSGGFAAAGGPLGVNINGNLSPLVWNSTTSFVSTGALIFGSLTATDAVTFLNPLDLNNTTGAVTRSITVLDNPAVSTDVALFTASLTKSNTGTVAIAKNGAGTLIIDKNTADNSNAFDGTLTINAGTFILRGTPQNGAALVMTPSATGTNLVLEQGASFLRAGSFIANATSAAGGITISAGPGGGEIRLNATPTRLVRTYLVNDNPQVDDDVVISVPIVNGPGAGEVHFSKEGAGRLVLTGDNAWLGATVFYKGTMVIDYGVSAAEKLRDAADLEPRGGVLVLKGNSAAPVLETVGNLSPGSSNLGVQGTNTSPLYAEPASIGSLVGTQAPNGGQSLIQLQPVGGQPVTLTFSGFIRNPGGGIVELETTDPVNGTFRSLQTGDLNDGRLLATNVLLDGRWIAQDGLGKIVQHFGTVQSDPGQWRAGQSVELNSPLSGSGVLGTSSVAGLIFSGTDTGFTINNDPASLLLSRAAVLVTPQATASLIQINGGKLLTTLPYKSAPGADLLLQNFSPTAVLKITSNLGHSDAPQGNTELITIAGGGTVELAGKSASLLTYAGATLLRGAVKIIGGSTLRVSGGDAISDYLPLDLGTAGNVGGTFQLNGATETIGGLLGVNGNQGVTSGVIDLGSGGVLTLNQTLANTYSGPLTGTGTLIKQGNAALTSNGSELTFGGALQITGGIINLTGNQTHGLTGAVTSVLLAGGEIFGEHNGGGLTTLNKLPDAATVTLAGTRGFGLQISSNTSGRSDSIAAIVVGKGANVITVNAANNTSQLTLRATQGTNALTRTADRGTLIVRGDNLGGGLGGSLNNSARILLGSGSTGLGLIGGGGTTPFDYSILPWAIGTTGDGGAAAAVGDSFVTYGPNGLRPLNTTSEYKTNYATATATENFSASTSQAGLVGTTLNSLRIDTSGGAVALSGSGVLTLNSGALLVATAGTTNAATISGFTRLAPGATNEFVIHVTSSNANPANAVLNLDSSLNEIGGGTAVTKSGNGTLRLGTSNTFAGGLTVNQGTVEFSDVLNTSLGSSGGAIRLAGGTLKYAGASPVSIATHPIVLTGPSSFYTPTGTGAGGNALNRGSSIDTGTQNMTIGATSGDGGFVKLGTSDLIVSGNALHTGATAIMSGDVFFNETLAGTSGLFLTPENVGGVTPVTISAVVKKTLDVNQLIVGGVFTSASSQSGSATLTVGDATNHPAVTIGHGGGDSFLIAGYHDEGAANGASLSLTKGTIDLRNAGSVNINVSRMFVGQNKGAGAGRTEGDLLLSTGPTSTGNTVTSGYVVVGNSPGPDSTGGGGFISNLTLGSSINNFNVDSMVVGGINSNGKILLPAGGTFTLRDRAGLGGADVYIGDNDDITNTWQGSNNSTLDTTSGTIDARINLLVIGRHGGNTGPTATTGGGVGALRFDAGEINAAFVQLAMVSTRGTTNGPTASNSFVDVRAQTLAEITQDGGTFRFGTMSRGEGITQYNWNGGTIESLPGQNATNQNVFITVNDLTLEDHFVSVPAGRTMTFEAGAGFNGSGSIFKTGAGTFELKGPSTYGGGTEIQQGTVLANNVSGSATGSFDVNVKPGAVLGGSGTVGGNVLLEASPGVGMPGGKLIVGPIPGQIGQFKLGLDSNGGDLDMDPGSILELEIQTNLITPLSDSLTLEGGLFLDFDGDPQTNAILSITDLGSARLTEGTALTLITYSGGWDAGLFKYNGTIIDDYDPVFNAASTIFYIGAYGFRLDYDAGFSGNNVNLIAVPEPGALASLIGGIGMLLGLQRFRRWSAKG